MQTVIRWLIVLAVVSGSQSFYPFSPKIVFLDVGQGDSTLVLPEPGIQILIDGGPGDAVLEKIGRYIPVWDRKIELLILTHPHQDHIEGLLDALERYKVENIIYNFVCYPSKEYEIFLKLSASREKPLLEGNGHIFSRQEDWLLNIVYPPNLDYRDCYTVSNVNNGSIVTYFEYKQTKFLLMGDAENEEEKALLDEKLLMDIDILKAGHHCSRTSSSDEFLDFIRPQLAICSVGTRNIYGHPHQETLQKFKERGIEYLLTSTRGDIVINL